MKSAEELIQERQATHGDAWERVGPVINLMEADRLLVNHSWMFLSFVMIVSKLLRIVAGDATVIDHWADIEGYARLVRNRLQEQQRGGSK